MVVPVIYHSAYKTGSIVASVIHGCTRHAVNVANCKVVLILEMYVGRTSRMEEDCEDGCFHIRYVVAPTKTRSLPNHSATNGVGKSKRVDG